MKWGDFVNNSLYNSDIFHFEICRFGVFAPSSEKIRVHFSSGFQGWRHEGQDWTFVDIVPGVESRLGCRINGNLIPPLLYSHLLSTLKLSLPQNNLLKNQGCVNMNESISGAQV